MYIILRGAIKKKNVPKSGKSPKGGGGVSAGDQKVHNSKCGLFDKRGGGGHIFIFFPNVNAHFRYFSWRKNKLVLKWFLGKFKCFKLIYIFWHGGWGLGGGGWKQLWTFSTFPDFILQGSPYEKKLSFSAILLPNLYFCIYFLLGRFLRTLPASQYMTLWVFFSFVCFYGVSLFSIQFVVPLSLL